MLWWYTGISIIGTMYMSVFFVISTKDTHMAENTPYNVVRLPKCFNLL